MTDIRAYCRVSALVLLVASCIGSCAAHGAGVPVEGTVEIKNLQLPPGCRITAFDVRMRRGFVKVITDMPPGWALRVENGDGGEATIRAESISSVTLTESDLERISFGILKYEDTAEPFLILGSYSCQIGGDKSYSKHVPLGAFSFDFIEKYPRHRLVPSP